VEKYNGEIPNTREELMEFPGVGRKTANVVLSIAKGIPAIAVDTHVFRVSNRLGLAKAKNVLETEKQLMKNIPEEKWSDAHHWLIWHGRKICRAQHPLCAACPIGRLCDSFSIE
jgi:endonuclease-3